MRRTENERERDPAGIHTLLLLACAAAYKRAVSRAFAILRMNGALYCCVLYRDIKLVAWARISTIIAGPIIKPEGPRAGSIARNCGFPYS